MYELYYNHFRVTFVYIIVRKLDRENMLSGNKVFLALSHSSCISTMQNQCACIMLKRMKILTLFLYQCLNFKVVIKFTYLPLGILKFSQLKLIRLLLCTYLNFYQSTHQKGVHKFIFISMCTCLLFNIVYPITNIH